MLAKKGFATLSIMAVSLATIVTGCGVTAPTQSNNTTNFKPAESSGPPNLAAAKNETLIVWHGDQENDIVKFLKAFTAKTGIKTEEQRLLPGAVMPKLNADFKSGTSEADVWMSSDTGLMYDLMKEGRLLRYDSPQMATYQNQYKSNPEGYYTTYFINVGPIMYNPKVVKPQDAPKTWSDLLDPKWKGQIGFQDASAGTQYAWWYLLKEIVPNNYFTQLEQNQPRAYSSSTQMLQDILNGDLKIGGKVSIFQYVKAARKDEPVKMVMPAEGVPASLQAAGILGNTQHADAAKVFMDFLLSQEGQQLWNNIQGSYSARSDVKISGLPDLSTLKLLTVNNIQDFSSNKTHGEFVTLWNQITGLR